ncbi:hypothetical protein [Sphingomonas hankookensis]|uniref:hypothetical protein n=1 Tax=Sphingomonas hankookensis TaxID=563996 RepID=UPI00234F275B|nr:hypothetical protein [Sphingomonas hankookensis]WCP73913.1 hypothetical protein PPZ50_18295 [Sphingomonas hankookensis]
MTRKDGAWQFHDAGPGSADMAEARVVSLRSMVERDPTVGEILDLPPGGRASRGAPGGRWVCERC